MAVASECVVNGLSSTGVATPPWLDTLECDVVFVMAGRQNACENYHNTSCETMTELSYYNIIFSEIIVKLAAAEHVSNLIE